MSTPTAERLRVLVSDYYHGLVTFESYREQRGQLLDALGAAPREQPKPSSAAMPAAPPPAAPTRARVEPPKAPARAAPVARPQRLGALAAGTAVVVAIIVVVLLQLGPTDEVQQAPPPDAASLSPGEALLERFIERNAWDRDAASTLAVAWNNALSEADRELAIASPSYRRFSDALRRRLREEEALATSAELETLSTLAAGLGVRATTTPASAPAPRAATRTLPAAESPEPAAPPRPAVADAEPTPRSAQPEAAAEAAAVAPAPTTASAAAAAPTPAVTTPATVTPAANPPAAAPATEQPAASTTTPRSSTCSAQLLNTRRPFCNDALASGGNGPALAIVPAGSFSMGDAQAPNASPAHSVSIGAPFAMAINEVSFAEFRLYCTRSNNRCPDNPWSDDAYPVVQVSWAEAMSYAQWLSSETGQVYRLPSEAEWEYAARAGSTSPYPFGDNVTPAAARSSVMGPVSSPLPSGDRSVNGNAFRLWHMIGNVREWVADGWYPDYANAPSDGTARSSDAVSTRPVRGGSYADSALPLRSAARLALEAGARDATTGFRVVRELTP